MARLLDHRAGQFRAEVFEELVHQILLKEFPGATISQDYMAPGDSLAEAGWSTSARRIDFHVQTATGEIVLVDAKAPYSQNMRAGTVRTLRQLESLTERFQVAGAVNRVILALAAELSEDASPEVEKSRVAFASQGVALDVWDEGVIRGFAETLLGQHLASLSTEDMGHALAAAGVPVVVTVPRSGERGDHPIETPTVRTRGKALKEGFHKDAIVLMADFCSFSAFVQASGGDYELVTSVMGRLYREARKHVLEAGGILDKFMGDGLLAFWLPNAEDEEEVGGKLMNCVTRLVGMAVKLAEEWQEQIDLSVTPTGMRCGAALGEVYFIAENPNDPHHIHAISDAINIAARLQTAAAPNSLVVSNRLRTSYFRGDGGLTECEPDAKNIGKVRAWRKSLM